jgi:multidrug efflux pump subunit AcrA (membrane-fusion protein)
VTSSHRPRLAAGALLALAALPLSACTEVESETATGYEPATLDDRNRVTFTAEGAERTGLQTAPVTRHGRRSSVPYAALLYDPEGGTYVYTNPARRTFRRVAVKVARIDGDQALLSDGPPAGTEVVTVGAAEVYGTELEVPSH